MPPEELGFRIGKHFVSVSPEELPDEMGLGKTLEALAFLSCLKAHALRWL